MSERNRPQDLVTGSGRRVEPKAMQQMISARLDAALVAELRVYCNRSGLSLSEALRDAVVQYLHRAATSETTILHWSVVNGTRDNEADTNEFDTILPALT
jgi:hypothetical protein